MLLEIKDYAGKGTSEMDLVGAESKDQEEQDKNPIDNISIGIDGLPMTRLTRSSVSDTDITLGGGENNNNHHQIMMGSGDESYNKLSRLSGHENHVFSMTPSDSINFDEAENKTGGAPHRLSSSDLSSGPGGGSGLNISDSESPAKFQLSPDGKGRKNQDSRESLIPEGRK